MKVQSLGSLISDMRAVARGEVAAPADAATPSAETADLVIRLSMVEDRVLLSGIRDEEL